MRNNIHVNLPLATVASYVTGYLIGHAFARSWVAREVLADAEVTPLRPRVPADDEPLAA
ncbi:MAG TPA: hypothetical protein VNS55_04965 [Nocardioides sp.]|nr:hypothetical protein [Nocardioides sp.]